MPKAAGEDRVVERIAECAAVIMAALGEVGEINVLRLSEFLDERSALTYQALGWLAREGRIRYRQRESQVFISLTEEEKRKHENDKSKRR
jgi:Mn-dependent DtxR family transcriptional regulator